MQKPTTPPAKAISMQAKFMQAATKEHAATLTKKAMKATFNALAKCAKSGRWGDVTPQNITQKQIRSYVQQRLSDGLSVRATQNQVSHIRRTLKGVGRVEVEASFSNKDLGIPSATRIGTGKVTDPEVLAQALERADPIQRAWIRGMITLGLRERELVRSGPSLRQWESRLVACHPTIYLDAGAKTGRSRDIFVPEETRGETLQAVRDLIAVADSQGGRVVAQDTLEAACSHVSYSLGTLGLKSENSPHSLRRIFACDRINYHRAQGLSEVESRSRVSTSLGHGDSRQRGTWVWNNYVRPTEQVAA